MGGSPRCCQGLTLTCLFVSLNFLVQKLGRGRIRLAILYHELTKN